MPAHQGSALADDGIVSPERMIVSAIPAEVAPKAVRGSLCDGFNSVCIQDVPGADLQAGNDLDFAGVLTSLLDRLDNGEMGKCAAQLQKQGDYVAYNLASAGLVTTCITTQAFLAENDKSGEKESKEKKQARQRIDQMIQNMILDLQQQAEYYAQQAAYWREQAKLFREQAEAAERETQDLQGQKDDIHDLLDRYKQTGELDREEAAKLLGQKPGDLDGMDNAEIAQQLRRREEELEAQRQEAQHRAEENRKAEADAEQKAEENMKEHQAAIEAQKELENQTESIKQKYANDPEKAKQEIQKAVDQKLEETNASDQIRTAEELRTANDENLVKAGSETALNQFRSTPGLGSGQFG